MNYSEFSKDIDKTSFGLIKKAAGMLVSQLLGPLTTATDPFFRKKMGARYFNLFHWLGGIALWAFATWYDKHSDSFIGDVVGFFGYYKTATWFELHHYMWPGIVLTVLFALWGFASISDNWARETSGEIWHSMSRGVSGDGKEDRDLDWMITMIIVVPLFIFTPFCGVLYLVSRILSGMFSELERKRAYNRYLDAMDAQIEANFLERTLLQGASPKDNYGLYGLLPGKYEGKHRANIAKAGAGGDLDLFGADKVTIETTAVKVTPQNLQ
jgi:hypothetical protein